MFIIYGAFYGTAIINDVSSASFAQTVSALSNVQSNPISILNLSDEAQSRLENLKIVYSLAPIVNTDCLFDSFSAKEVYQNINFRGFVGLSFNNEIYFQMARGLIHPDLLEFISNQQIFGSCILAPSMYIKKIWDSDVDYKVYKDQIFTNLHETHSNSRENKQMI